ncbi:claudin domain-containing protein 2 [Crotalus adamanteus]|uniref:Claudin domain-containing protein 2 n=1 Tax=Crotalus adamanteus TaxID=8729 RepID=A0AAW1AXH7_CROAD
MIAGAVSLVGLCMLNVKCSFGNTSISTGWITYNGSFIAGFCVMIAMSIFSGTFGSTNQYGWSFGLGWASFPLYLLTGVEFVSASLHATRTFMFLGMIAGTVSLVGLCILNKNCSLGNTSISMGWIACIGSFMAGFCVLIAMSIFSGKIGTTNRYGWSFGLGWASFPLYLLTGSLLYMLHKSTATSA